MPGAPCGMVLKQGSSGRSILLSPVSSTAYDLQSEGPGAQRKPGPRTHLQSWEGHLERLKRPTAAPSTAGLPSLLDLFGQQRTPHPALPLPQVGTP
jgi:hypothetical protein